MTTTRRLWRGVAPLLAVALAVAACGGAGADRLRPRRPLIPTPEEAFRAEPPPVVATPPFAAPEVHVEALPNGLTLVLLRRSTMPAAAVTLVARRAGEDGRSSPAGLAWFLGEVLAGGTVSGGGRDLHPFERRGLTPSIQVGRDRAVISLRVPAHRLEEVLPLFAQVAVSPAFDDAHVEEQRRIALAGIEATLRTPGDRAWQQARRLLYGDGHPYASPIYGSADAIRAITREQLVAHHRRAWVPQESALVVVGDIEAPRLRQLVQSSFGGWARGEEEPGAPEPPPLPPGRTATRVAGISSLSRGSTIMVVEQGPSRLGDDYVAYSLLSRVMGGMFTSRLNVALREERGYSYGVSAAFTTDGNAGELSIITTVSQDRVREAVLAIVAEMRRLREEGPDEGELETSRALMREELVEALEDTEGAAYLLAGLFAVGLGPEELPRLEAAIRAVTAADVRAAAVRWLRPELAPVAVTGDLDALRRTLPDLELGQVELESGR